MEHLGRLPLENGPLPGPVCQALLRARCAQRDGQSPLEPVLPALAGTSRSPRLASQCAPGGWPVWRRGR
eukprot:13595619-Alexandrium_andersonii.AAC.1